MKMLAYGRWAVLALLLILAIPMRADAHEHWYHPWYRYHHHLFVPAYGIPAYGIAPSYVGVAPVFPSYAPAYGVVPSYGFARVPAYAPYPHHWTRRDIAANNQLGRMERYAATHPLR